MGERERASAALRVRANASARELSDAFRREVVAAARADNRRAFESACAAYAALLPAPDSRPPDAFTAALSDAAPGDVLLSVAAHARARAWLPADQPRRRAPPAFAAPKTSFRRWKWEAASLPSSAVVPQLARRPAAARARPAHPAALPPPLTPPAPDDAALAALIPHAPATRPAAAAAAAAYRALAPYLAPDEQDALRARFAARAPLDALAAVLDAARVACGRYEPPGALATAPPVWPATSGGSVWADGAASPARAAAAPFDPLPRVPGALAAVWGRDADEGAANGVMGAASPWAAALFAPPAAAASPPRTLDPAAAPFSMDGVGSPGVRGDPRQF